MIYIQKQNEPPLLRKFKKEKQDNKEATTYEDFTNYKEGFEELRNKLLEEQKYICCYCLQPIPIPLKKSDPNYDMDKDKLLLHRMKTEHFYPKGGIDGDRTKDLDYSNLLAACLGNKKSKKENHCDSSKGSKVLHYLPNPALGKRKDFKKVFKYNVNFHKREGEVLVYNEDENIQAEIDNILNLNEQNLRNKRFNTIAPIIKRIEQIKRNPKKIQAIIELYEQPDKNGNCLVFVIWSFFG